MTRIQALPEIPPPSQPLTPAERAAVRRRIAEQLHQALREDTDTRNKLVWWSMTGRWPGRGDGR